MAKLNNITNKKEGSSAGMFGMRDKWKKASRSTGQKKGKTSPLISPPTSPSPLPQSPVSPRTYHQSPGISSSNSNSNSDSNSKKKKKPRRVPIDCFGRNRNPDDSASEVDMISIDLRTPPTTPSPIKSNRIAAKTMSMMTPDMLETLGLTELEEEDQFRYGNQNNGNGNGNANTNANTHTNTTTTIRSPATAPLAGTSRRNRTETSRERQNSKSNFKNKTYHGCDDTDNDTDITSCLYFGDNDTNTKGSSESVSSSSSYSSNESYEPIPRDPSRDDWTFVDEDDDDENNTCMQFYRETKTTVRDLDCDFDAFNCVSMVLAMPLACGLVCIDNLLDTKFFDSAAQKYQTTNTNTNTDTNTDTSTSSKSETGTETETETLHEKDAKQQQKQKHSDRKRKKKKNQRKEHRGNKEYNNPEDEINDICDTNYKCVQERPTNKIIAPCW